MTSVGEKNQPATITAGDKATTQSIVKLQSFVRGCMCRGKVERVVASLIQEMLRNGEVSKASITSMLETSNATLKTSDAEVNSESKFVTITDYNDQTDNTDDTDADLIDGIHYPRFLPDDVLDQSFNCSITLEKEDIMVKSNQPSSSLLKNQSSIRGRIDDRNIPDFHSREPSQEKRRSVASVSSTPGTITDQLGMNQGSSFNFESSIYSVPFLKSSPTPSCFDGSPALRMLHGLDTSIHSLGDDALLLSCESREKSLLSKGNHHQKLGSSVHTFLSPDKFLDRCSSVRDMISRGEEGWNNQNFDKASLRDIEIEDSASSVGCGEGVSSTGSINSVNTESASDAASSEFISTKRKYTLQEKVAAFQKNQETPTISSYKKGASIFGSKRPQRNKSAPSRSSGHLAAFVPQSSENSNSINSEGFIATRDGLEDVVGDSNFCPPLSIAERIEQLGSANRVHDTRIVDCESSEKVISSNDAEIKRVDYATRLYIMDNSALKIQALTRGYLYRKKDKEATVAVVKWLKQHKMLDEDAPASTLLLSEEMREEAVQVLEAEIEQFDPSESNHNESDPSEHSGDQNGRSTSQTTMSLTQRKQAYEQMTKVIKSVGDTQKTSSKLVSAKISAPLSERKRAFEKCLPQNDATFQEQDREYFEFKKEKAQKAMATLNKKQHESAVKIQALARGFIERKFDVRSMMVVVQWVKEQQDTFLPYYDPEDYEPDTDVLESAWTFLESNNTWTKDKEVLSKENTDSDDASFNILQDDPHPTKINVQELLNTWEWLLSNEANKRKNRRFAEEKEDREPTNANLQDLQEWIENNRVLVNIDGELEFCDKGKRKWSKPNCVPVVRTKDGVWTVDLDTNQNDSGEQSQRTEEREKNGARKANRARSDKISAFSDKIEGENTVKRNDGIVTSAIEGGESMIVSGRDELDLSTTHGSECYEGKIVASGVHCRFPGSQRASILELESTEVRKTKDLVDLWKFLVSHGMDMRALRRYEERAGETIDQERENGRTIDLLTTHSNAACTPNCVQGETQQRDDCADYKNSGAVVSLFGQDSHTMPTVSSRKKAFESHLAKNGRETEKSIHLARSPSDISIQVPKYSRHKMHDEMYINKGDGVVYINDDVAASSANLSEFSNTNASRENYRQHKMHDEMYGSEGDGVEYIAEDLSRSYADLNYLQKSCSNENGRHAGYGRHKMHDELSDNNGDGVQYIDEDLSASYTSLTVLSQGGENIPSLKDMMNYWAVSNYHYNALQKQRFDGSSSDQPLDGQEPVLEKTKWRESAADNDFLCALAWLRNKGIELSTLDKRSTGEEFSKGDSIASDAKKDIMVNSLNWLQSRGYCCENRSSEGCSIDDAQSKDRKSDYEDTFSSSSSNDVETSNDDLPSAVLEAVLPQKIEMADTLKWLISQGYRTPSRKSSNGDSREKEKLGEKSSFDFDKALADSDVESIVRISPPSSSEISNALDWLESREKEAQQACGLNENLGKAAEKNVDFENVLHSLSWLKKNGFKLGKPSGAQNPEEVYDSTPSRKDVQQALETLVKDSDPSVDESIAREEKTSSDIKSRSKFDDNMERTLAWLKQRGMKVPRKSKSNSKNQSRTSGSTGSQPSKVIPVLSKQANYTAFGFPTCRDLETSDRGLPQHVIQFQRDPSRKMKARVSKVPNERKNATKFNARSDGVSPALQWLQFKKGIPIDNKSTTTKPEILSFSGTVKKENTFSNGNSKTNNSRRNSKKLFPDEVSVKEMEAVLKLSETQSSAPTSSDMKQALSWLKLRESRRQAQAAALSFVPQRSLEVDAQVGQSNSEVRIHQPKVPGDNEQVAQLEKGHHTDEQRQVNEALEDDKMEKSSGQRGYKKTQKTERCGKKSRSRSCDKKQENIKSNLRQSRGDMTKALMFLQQRRGTATKTKSTSQNIDFGGDIETFKPIAPSYSSPKKSSANKANTLREAAELVKFESTEKSEMKGLSSADTVGESKALPRSQEEIDFVNALNFLKGSTSKAQADEPYFAKLDSMLPRKPSQSNEARAKDMAKALKWIKKQGVTMSGSIQSKVSKATSPEDSPIISGSDVKTMEAYTESGDTKASEPCVSTSLSPRKSSVNATDCNIAVSEDYQNCIRWLSEEDRDSIKDAKHFKKLDKMLPKTAKQSIEERARDMVKALQWVKKSSAKKEAATSNTTKDMSDVDDKTANIKKKSQSPGRRASTSPTSRAKPKLTVRKRKSKQSSAPGPSLPDLSEDNDTKNALQWIKNQERESLADAAAFKKLDSMLPKRAGQTPEDRATEMSKALKLTKKNYDDRTLKPPTDEAMMSLEEEEQQAYRFLLAKKEGKDYMSMEDAAVLKKVDNMMPTKTNQSSEERAKQMVKMIGWLKKKGKI